MAKIIKSTITLDLNVLQCNENMSDNSINIELTVDEAKELYNMLKDQFNDQQYVTPSYPQGVRDWPPGYPSMSDGSIG